MDTARAQAMRNIDVTIADVEAMLEAVQRIAPDPSRTSLAVGDGRAIFLGHGVFVNRLFGLGWSSLPQASDLDAFELLSSSLGHDPTIDVSTHADPELALLLGGRGYSADGTVHVLARKPVHLDPLSSRTHPIEAVSEDTLELWCEATALGWGHVDPDRRAGSDLYGRAAFLAQDPGLLIARSAHDGRVLGCAAIAIVGKTAMVGAMSTVPAERRTGVQSALIDERLHIAAERGCSLAVTQSVPGEASNRNLLRKGFALVDTITSWVKPT